ncbi:MAG: preprotein translocase subunit SecE [Oscillospiraceae bacterium]|nr:preprotein translocase subunit SecE [Oscillospiraceae bacterium]
MADSNKTENAKAANLGRFLTETKAELKKVTWPSKQQLLHNTGVILVFIIISCIILSLLDLGFQEIMQLLQNISL